MAPTALNASERKVNVLVVQEVPLVESAERLEIRRTEQHGAAGEDADVVSVIEGGDVRFSTNVGPCEPAIELHPSADYCVSGIGGDDQRLSCADVGVIGKGGGQRLDPPWLDSGVVVQDDHPTGTFGISQLATAPIERCSVPVVRAPHHDISEVKRSRVTRVVDDDHGPNATSRSDRRQAPVDVGSVVSMGNNDHRRCWGGIDGVTRHV